MYIFLDIIIFFYFILILNRWELMGITLKNPITGASMININKENKNKILIFGGKLSTTNIS